MASGLLRLAVYCNREETIWRTNWSPIGMGREATRGKYPRQNKKGRKDLIAAQMRSKKGKKRGPWKAARRGYEEIRSPLTFFLTLTNNIFLFN